MKNGRPGLPTDEQGQAHVIISFPSRKSPRILKEFIQMWQSGLSLSEISRQTGRSRDMVRRALKRHEFETNPKSDEFDPTVWRKRRRSSSHPPYGFCYFQGNLVENPKEQEVLLLIIKLSKEGMNPNMIASHLKAKRLRPRRADSWNRNSIILILNRTLKQD